MSYSNAEIDFSGIHVACLIGENGAGKSSLLDAITWTIWEEGRAKTDELIKLGQTEMFCEVDFYMEENLYRIYRSRAKGFKTSQGKSSLEFQIYNPQKDEWKLLTLSSTRQTQDLIIKAIKMDYPTFVNSVYLKQGKADEFTVKRPSERKQILADILDLKAYDKLCEAAKLKSTKIEQEIMLETNSIGNINEKILKEDEVKQKYFDASIRLKSFEDELNILKTSLSLKEKDLNEKREKEKQVQVLEKSRQNQESLITILNEQIKNLQSKEAKCKQLISNKEKITRDYKDYLNLKRQFEIIDQNKERFHKLTLEKSFLERELKEKIMQAEQNLAVYKSKLTERESSKNTLNERLKNEQKFNELIKQSENKIQGFKALQESLTHIESEGLELKHNKELILLEVKKLLSPKKK